MKVSAIICPIRIQKIKTSHLIQKIMKMKNTFLMFSCILFTLLFLVSGVGADDSELCRKGNLEVCTRLCDGGYTKDCNFLGLSYFLGEGIKQDYFKAFEVYKKSCDLGYADGCCALGFMYGLGQGIKQDYLKAFEFSSKACDGDVASCCSMLGAMYHSGEGVKKDIAKEKEFFGKACDLKDQAGCEGYAKLNSQGK
jgi:TPR repeat protein